MDQSHLDKKYFIDYDTYNCPFCKRGSVSYSIVDHVKFNWSAKRTVFIYIIKCEGCELKSAHFSNYSFFKYSTSPNFELAPSKNGEEVKDFDYNDLDKYFFHHQPTSFFTINPLIPEKIRDLVSEAEGCREMSYLVGASGALRKAIYEFTKDQLAEGESYQDKMKWLKEKYPNIHSGYIDALSNIQDMTSENLHEKDGSWVPWGNDETQFLIEVVKAVLDEVYVMPKNKQSVIDRISALKGSRVFLTKEEVSES